MAHGVVPVLTSTRVLEYSLSYSDEYYSSKLLVSGSRPLRSIGVAAGHRK